MRWWRSRKNARAAQLEEWSGPWLAQELASGRLPDMAAFIAERTEDVGVEPYPVRADRLTAGMRLNGPWGITVTECYPVPDTRRQWIWVKFSSGHIDLVHFTTRYNIVD